MLITYGGRVSLPANVNILFNNPPIVRPDHFAVTLGDTVELPVLDNDFDPEKITLRVVANSAAGLGIAWTNNGQLFYTAGTNTGRDSFTYTARDTFGGTGTTNVLVTILPSTTIGATWSLAAGSVNPTRRKIAASFSTPTLDEKRPRSPDLLYPGRTHTSFLRASYCPSAAS